MPGLASSYAIIENDELRHQFQVYMEASEFSEGHLFEVLRGGSLGSKLTLAIRNWNQVV